ncbi:hypothetical protein U91I_02964 [alpha proteobacterium U9-1i]|nr:hypothetical protein U91I_02964 [alpha proteobacterium U9-1i]
MFLDPLARGADIALLAMRLVVGLFLIWGVWDNVVDPARMAEFEGFLGSQGFVRPDVMAPLSVWAQLACGVAFVLGIGTRWAGLVCAFNFVVALAMVDAKLGIRPAFPSAMLVVVSLYFATKGAGSFSLDRLLLGAKSA